MTNTDKMEEIYKLIEEIEQDRKLVELEKKEKRKAKWQEKKRQERRTLWALKTIASTIGLAEFLFFSGLFFHSSSIEEEYQIFSNRKVTLNEEQEYNCLKLLEKELGISITENKEDYLILNAIRKNEYLENFDKEICYQLVDLLKENPYINREDVYLALLNMDISRQERPKEVELTIVGQHEMNPLANYHQIKIYEEEDTDVLTHEGIHTIISNGSRPNVPRWLNEGMTELLSKEYYTKDPFIIDRYQKEIAFVKMLCEIVEPEIVLESYTTGNMDILYSELAQYEKSGKKGAEKALKTIDDSLTEMNKKEEKLAKEKDHAKKQGIKTKKIKSMIVEPVPWNEDTIDALRFLETCMENKAAVMTDFDKSEYYYNKKLLTTIFVEDPNQAYNDIIDSYGGHSGKAYFSKGLKETGCNKVMAKTKLIEN